MLDSIDSSSVLFEALGQLQKYPVFGRFANRICQKAGTFWIWKTCRTFTLLDHLAYVILKIYKGNPYSMNMKVTSFRNTNHRHMGNQISQSLGSYSRKGRHVSLLQHTFDSFMAQPCQYSSY